MALFATACGLFALDSESLPLAVAACILLGFSTGANFVLITVVTAKSFNPAVFGVVYGTIMSLTTMGAAVGPLLISMVYDATGTYSPAFWLGIGVAALAAVLLQNLRPVGLPPTAA